MLPPSLTAYLDDCKQKGYTFEAINPLLVSAGWNLEQIAEGKRYYESGNLKPVTTIGPSVIKSDEYKSPGRNPLKIVLMIMIILIILTGVGSVPLFLVATEKIKVNNDKLQQAAETVVFKIPFIPKTTRYILEQAELAQKKVSRSSFDVSFAAASDSFMSTLGSSEIGLRVNGYVDYSDKENPKLQLTADITKEFNAELRKLDKFIYFKINKLPLLLITSLGFDPDKINPLLNSWVAYDSTPLETEARKNLPQASDITPNNKASEDRINKMLSEDVLPNIKVNNDKVDEFEAYRLDFEPSDELLNTLADKITAEVNKQKTDSLVPVMEVNPKKDQLSDTIKNFKISMFVDKKDYYVRKTLISFIVESPKSSSTTLDVLPMPLTLTKSPVRVSAAILLTDFGQVKQIDKPDKSITPEEYYAKFYEAMQSPKLSENSFSAANNTKRRSDINAVLNAVYQYAVDNRGQFPKGIGNTSKSISKTGANICQTLVPNYMAAMPVDPSLNNGTPVTDCNSQYETGYTININQVNSRVTVTAPMAELGEIITTTR